MYNHYLHGVQPKLIISKLSLRHISRKYLDLNERTIYIRSGTTVSDKLWTTSRLSDVGSPQQSVAETPCVDYN